MSNNNLSQSLVIGRLHVLLYYVYYFYLSTCFYLLYFTEEIKRKMHSLEIQIPCVLHKSNLEYLQFWLCFQQIPKEAVLPYSISEPVPTSHNQLKVQN